MTTREGKPKGCGLAATGFRKKGPKRAYFIVFPCATQYRLEQKKRIGERYQQQGNCNAVFLLTPHNIRSHAQPASAQVGRSRIIRIGKLFMLLSQPASLLCLQVP